MSFSDGRCWRPACVSCLCVLILVSCSGMSKKPIEEAPERFHLVLKKLRDEDFNVRMEAARELGRMGPSAEPAVPYLVEALKDNAVKVRIWAALALGEIGPDAKEAIPELKKATTREYNEWKDAREAAKQALEKVEGY